MSDPTIPSGGHPVPDAGWYSDPAGGDGTRWWDGKGWTDHVQPGSSASTITPAAGPGPGPGPGPDGGAPGSEVPWWAQTNDGAAPSWWSDAPPVAPTGPPAGMPFTMPATVPAGRQPLAEGAVKALVFGLISLVCCGIILGPWAIYTGSQARFRIRVSNGRLRGDGLALAGMALGALSVLLFFYSLWLFSTGRAHFIRPTSG